MIARPLLDRNLPLLACLLAVLGACGLQGYLRVEPRAWDPALRLFLGGGGNSAVLADGADLFLVDAKFSGMARQLRQDLEGDAAHAVRRMLLTHSHVDHTAGLALYPRVGAVLVHPRTRARLEASGVNGPFVEVERELVLTLGGERVRVKYLGVGHTDGDLVALLEGRRLLLAGDLLMNGREPEADPAHGGDLRPFRATLEALLELDFTWLIPGHGDPMTRAQVERVRDYLLAVERYTADARARGLTEAQAVAQARFPQWDDLEPVPVMANREMTVRALFRTP